MFWGVIFKNYTSALQISGQMDAQPSGRRKTWCQETLCHLSQGTGWYLASWSCLCSAVLRGTRRVCRYAVWILHEYCQDLCFRSRHVWVIASQLDWHIKVSWLLAGLANNQFAMLLASCRSLVGPVASCRHVRHKSVISVPWVSEVIHNSFDALH